MNQQAPTMTKNFMAKLRLLRPKYTTVRIQDQPFNFYSLSAPMIAEMRAVAGPLGVALGRLFENPERDEGSVVEAFEDGNEKIGRVTRTPAGPEVVALRSQQRLESIQQLVDLIFSHDAQLLLGRLVADSLREDFNRPVQSAEVAEFMNSEHMDLSLLVEFLRGVVEANREVFGPLLPKVASNLREEVAEQVEARIRDLVGRRDDPMTGEEKPTMTTTGSSLSSSPASSSPDISPDSPPGT